MAELLGGQVKSMPYPNDPMWNEDQLSSWAFKLTYCNLCALAYFPACTICLINATIYSNFSQFCLFSAVFAAFRNRKLSFATFMN